MFILMGIAVFWGPLVLENQEQTSGVFSATTFGIITMDIYLYEEVNTAWRYILPGDVNTLDIIQNENAVNLDRKTTPQLSPRYHTKRERHHPRYKDNF